MRVTPYTGSHTGVWVMHASLRLFFHLALYCINIKDKQKSLQGPPSQRQMDENSPHELVLTQYFRQLDCQC